MKKHTAPVDDSDEIVSVMSEAEEVEMFGDKECRWYQIAMRGGVEQALEDGHKRILVVGPTGSGKTVTSGMIFCSERVRRYLGVKPGEPLRLMFVAHTHRLLTQAERAYAQASNIEFIMQSAFSPIPDDVLEQGWHITCLDEAHHEAMMSIQLHLDQIGERPLIGLTATPDRADGCVIKFDPIIEPISREQAVAEGWLAETELNSFIDTPMKDKTVILTDIISAYFGNFGQTMVFVHTKAEVRRLHAQMLEMGASAVAILDQSDEELDVILDQFSQKEIQFLINCKRINEGVDCVGVTDIVLGRQFGSYPQLNQVIGRGSRPDSDCRVWELINPLSGRNLDTTVVVGTPKRHRLINKQGGAWVEREFDYTTHTKAIDPSLNPTRIQRGPRVDR